MSETVAAFRLDRLESDVHGMKASLDRLEVAFTRLEATLTATLPHLATKAELAIGVLLAAYALGLAGVAALPVLRALLHIGG